MGRAFSGVFAIQSPVENRFPSATASWTSESACSPRMRHMHVAAGTQQRVSRRGSLLSLEQARQKATSPEVMKAKKCFAKDGGTRSRGGEISFRYSAAVTNKEGHTTEQGATSYSMTCTTNGKLSKMSDGCGCSTIWRSIVFLMGVNALARFVAPVIRAEEEIPSHAGTQISILQNVQQTSITRCTIPPWCWRPSRR